MGLELFPAIKQTLKAYAVLKEHSPWQYSSEEVGSNYFKWLKQVKELVSNFSSDLAPAILYRIWGAKVQITYEGKEEILSLYPWHLTDAQFCH